MNYWHQADDFAKGGGTRLLLLVIQYHMVFFFVISSLNIILLFTIESSFQGEAQEPFRMGPHRTETRLLRKLLCATALCPP